MKFNRCIQITFLITAQILLQAASNDQHTIVNKTDRKVSVILFTDPSDAKRWTNDLTLQPNEQQTLSIAETQKRVDNEWQEATRRFRGNTSGVKFPAPQKQHLRKILVDRRDVITPQEQQAFDKKLKKIRDEYERKREAAYDSTHGTARGNYDPQKAKEWPARKAALNEREGKLIQDLEEKTFYVTAQPKKGAKSTRWEITRDKDTYRIKSVPVK